MKTFWKVLALIFSAAALVLFFAPFIVTKTAGVSVTLTGSEIAFGTKAEVAGQSVQVAKSLYYLFAFIFTALSALFSALSLKWQKTMFASLATQVVSTVMAIIFLAFGAERFFDSRRLVNITGTRFDKFFIIFAVAVFVSIAVTVLSILMVDRIEVKEKGKKSIISKIIRFLREYASELKKVVWPGPRSVVKGTVVVLIMCAIACIFVFGFDTGLGALFGKIFGIPFKWLS